MFRKMLKIFGIHFGISYLNFYVLLKKIDNFLNHVINLFMMSLILLNSTLNISLIEHIL